MVVQGGFSLELIDAATGQPLNEYRGPSGTVHYAEAKPRGEYFLRFQVLEDLSADEQEKQDEQHSGMAYFRPSVDGKDLGFYTNLTAAQGARDVGLWTYVNGIGTNKALKFETAAATASSLMQMMANTTTAANDGDDKEEDTTNNKAPPLLYMGNVQVQIFKAVFTGYQKRVYSSVPHLTQEETVVAAAPVSISASSSLHELDEEPHEEETNGNSPPPTKNYQMVSACDNSSSGSKSDGSHKTTESATSIPVLRSKEGVSCFQQEIAEECPSYQPGDLVETITIHYGSVEALAQSGILVKGGLVVTVPSFVGVPPPVATTVTTPTEATLPMTVAPTENITNTSSSPTMTTLTPGLVPNPLAVVITPPSTTTPLASIDSNHLLPTTSLRSNKRQVSAMEESIKDDQNDVAAKKVRLEQQQQPAQQKAAVVSTN